MVLSLCLPSLPIIPRGFSFFAPEPGPAAFQGTDAALGIRGAGCSCWGLLQQELCQDPLSTISPYPLNKDSAPGSWRERGV